MKILRAARVVACATLSALVITGCGGGNGGGGGGNNIGGGGGGGTADSRAVLFDAISAKLKTLAGTQIDQRDQQTLAFLKTRPEFTDSGISDTGVTWGRFQDGTSLIIGNNLDVKLPTRQALVTRSSRAATRVTRDGGIPDTRRILLGVAMGPVFSTWSEEIRSMFNNQAYEPVGTEPTVDALKNLSDISVLYLLAHGGPVSLKNGGGKAYAVWTSTLRARDGTTDGKYDADLKDGSLTYFQAQAGNGTEANAIPTWETHYAITAKFITKYWAGKFNKNSLVFVNACSSAGGNALDFRLACLNAGASCYVGWTDRMVLDEAMFSAGYLFDRLLGANSDRFINTSLEGSTSKETPPQRAFEIILVLGEMGTKKRPGSLVTVDTTVAPDTHRAAKLSIMTLNANFAQLAPAIRDLSVNEQKDELAINGSFGDVKGVVLIGDSELKVKTWDQISIICDLPRTGAGSSGEVKVIVNGAQSSNAVPLTAWHGTATYTLEDAGTLKMVMHFDIRFRGDIHGPRTQPGEAPEAPACSFLHSLATNGTYAFSGKFDSPNNMFTEEWSGTGTMTAQKDGTATDNTIYCVGGIDKAKWTMIAQAFATKGNHVHTISRNFQGVIINEGRFDQDGFGVATFPPPGVPFQSSVSSNYIIAAGRREFSDDSFIANGAKVKHTLDWTAFTAEAAPTVDTTRGVLAGRKK